MTSAFASVAVTCGKVIFWDIDGTLAPYRFNGHVADPDGTENGMSLSEIERGIFLTRAPSAFMQKVVKTSRARMHVVMGHCRADKEESDKRIWIARHFPMMKHVLLTKEDMPKYLSILNFCAQNGIDVKDAVYVDDVIPFLRAAERHGICSYHVSSFLDWDARETK